MKKWLLWIILCIILVSILLYVGKFFSYSGHKAKLFVPIQGSYYTEYVLWEEQKIKENPDYKNLAIYIDINAKLLELINLDNNEVIKRYTIASGKSETPSPIGSWTIVSKSKWGQGFGTRWMGLNVPWGTWQEEHNR